MQKKIIGAICGIGIMSSQICFAQNALLQVKSKTLNQIKTATNANSINIAETIEQGNGTLDVATNIRLNTAPVLSDFHLYFQNGDHKIRHLGILHENGSMKASFADQNGDDRFEAYGRWFNVPNTTGGTIVASGGGTFNIKLPDAPPNTTLVLSGFSFQRRNDSDANLRAIGVKLDQSTSIATVTLIDDQGADFRLFGDSLGGAALSTIFPFGIIVGSGISMGLAAAAQLDSGQGTMRPYVATVQYAFVPNSHVADSGTVSGSNAQISAMRGQLPSKAGSNLAYKSFFMRFNNADHHLLGLGVHLLGYSGGSNVRDNNAITYRDNDTDDPINWIVDYVNLK